LRQQQTSSSAGRRRVRGAPRRAAPALPPRRPGASGPAGSEYPPRSRCAPVAELGRAARPPGSAATTRPSGRGGLSGGPHGCMGLAARRARRSLVSRLPAVVIPNGAEALAVQNQRLYAPGQVDEEGFVPFPRPVAPNDNADRLVRLAWREGERAGLGDVILA